MNQKITVRRNGVVGFKDSVSPKSKKWKKAIKELYAMFERGGKYYGIPVLLMHNLQIKKNNTKGEEIIYVPIKTTPIVQITYCKVENLKKI